MNDKIERRGGHNRKVTPQMQREIAEWDRKLLELGQTKQIAGRLGISTTLLTQWRRKLRAQRAESRTNTNTGDRSNAHA